MRLASKVRVWLRVVGTAMVGEVCRRAVQNVGDLAYVEYIA